MEEKNVTCTEDFDHGVVVIRHVPACVCTECGNTWYSLATAGELEKMVNRFVSLVGAEVSVVNYAKSAA